MLLPLTRRQIWLHLVRLQLPTLILAVILKYCINRELIFGPCGVYYRFVCYCQLGIAFIVGKTLKVVHKAHNPIYNETFDLRSRNIPMGPILNKKVKANVILAMGQLMMRWSFIIRDIIFVSFVFSEIGFCFYRFSVVSTTMNKCWNGFSMVFCKNNNLFSAYWLTSVSCHVLG